MVIRKRHHEYRLTLPPDQVPPLAPEKVAEMESNYDRVKNRFVDRKRRVCNSWCEANLREMAKEGKTESMYGGIYPIRFIYEPHGHPCSGRRGGRLRRC